MCLLNLVPCLSGQLLNVVFVSRILIFEATFDDVFNHVVHHSALYMIHILVVHFWLYDDFVLGMCVLFVGKNDCCCIKIQNNE